MRFCQIRWKSLRILWDFDRSGWNLTRFDEISLNPVKSHQIYLISCRNLDFFVGIWVFFDWFGFFEFWGRETEIDLLEWVSGGEGPPLITGVVGLAVVWLDPIGFFEWIGFSDGFGQPYPLVSQQSKNAERKKQWQRAGEEKEKEEIQCKDSEFNSDSILPVVSLVAGA